MYDDIVTVFNELGGIWYPYVIRKAYLTIDLASNQAKTGIEAADRARLHIKYKKNNEKLLIDNWECLRPKEWISRNEPEHYITFVDTKSFFIRGPYTSERIDDDAYRDGFFSYMQKNYDDCFEISNVATFTIIPHFEIGGR